MGQMGNLRTNIQMGDATLADGTKQPQGAMVKKVY